MKRLPTRKIIPLIAFAALMAGAIPVNWSFLQAEAGKLGLIDRDLTRIAKGKFTEELTAKYNESSPFRNFGIDAFGSLSYFAFHEARSGAQIGSSGVLFSNEEFETSPKTPDRIASAIRHIADVNALLKSRGITLIIAPLPLKADIESRHLGQLRLPSELQERYPKVLAALAATGVKTVDLRGRFLLAGQETPMFLASDTHWTPDGAATAAEALALASQPLELPGEKAFDLTNGEPVEHVGDLRKFVRLLPWLEYFGPRHDRISLVNATPRPGSEEAGLFDEVAVPVVLVGTSYSANPAFGFEAHLKAALQRDVLNLSEEGKGPFVPMQSFLKSAVLKDTPPQLVIWEMPIRYLDDGLPEDAVLLRGDLP
jgi:alginate O-acetyltransferase complex protein AlgJ